MRGRILNSAILFAFTIWAAVAFPWAVPGFAAMTASLAMIPYAVWREREGAALDRLLLSKLILALLGGAYLFGLLAGRPSGGAFWAAFGAVLAVGAPTIFLARRWFSSARRDGASG